MLTFWPAIGQRKTLTSRPTQSDTIPFQLTAFNNLVLKAILNDRDTIQLMLHTAASGVTLTDSARSRLKTITFNGAVDSVKSWGSSVNTSAFSNANSLAIGHMRWNNLTVWSDQNSGHLSDGKVSLDLFAGKIIELDFSRHVLIVHSTLPPNRAGYDQLPLTNKQGSLFLTATCQTRRGMFTHAFLLHSGYGGGVLLDDQVVEDYQLEQHIAITGEKILTDAYGHRITTKQGVLPGLRLGRYQLKEVPVGFFSGRIGQQRLSLLGGAVMKRFNWLIDADHGRVYVKPTAHHQRASGS